jgi:hypothetical protein
MRETFREGSPRSKDRYDPLQIQPVGLNRRDARVATHSANAEMVLALRANTPLRLMTPTRVTRTRDPRDPTWIHPVNLRGPTAMFSANAENVLAHQANTLAHVVLRPPCGPTTRATPPEGTLGLPDPLGTPSSRWVRRSHATVTLAATPEIAGNAGNAERPSARASRPLVAQVAPMVLRWPLHHLTEGLKHPQRGPLGSSLLHLVHWRLEWLN